MGRRLRYIPPGGALVEVTCRTLQGRHLLRPSRRLRSITHGILARAIERYPLDVHAFVFLSNHYHLLLTTPDARRLAEFMAYLNSNLAREAGRLVGWRERFWGRRYQAIIVSEETEAQVGRLMYLLSHGYKEGLVEKPGNWPGPHCLRELLAGGAVTGEWFDRTREYTARRGGHDDRSSDFVTRLVFDLTPMPCWDSRTDPPYREWIREVLRQALIRYQPSREASGALQQPRRLSVDERPRLREKSPAPWFHCASREARRRLVSGYSWFRAAYRRAADSQRAGGPPAPFPAGCFPPALPFVGG